MRAAIGLGYTCWKMYDDTESGMGPESILFQPNLDENGRRLGFDGLRWREKVQEWERRGRKGALVGTEGWPEGGLDESDYMIRDTRHLLRPEVSSMHIRKLTDLTGYRRSKLCIFSGGQQVTLSGGKEDGK